MNNERPLVFAASLPGQKRSLLYRCNPDGTGRVVVPTGGKTAFYPIWSPDGMEIVFTTSEAEEAPLLVVGAEGKAAARPLTKTPAYAWLNGNAEEALTLPGGQKLSWKPREDAGITSFELTDAKGKRAVKIHPGKGAPTFADRGISGGVLGFEVLPAALNAVLGWQLTGGNREGKWKVGLKIDLTTGTGTYWGEYGYSGMMFAPDGKRFITCFNRVNAHTEKEEHTLCLGESARPERLKQLVRATGLIVADWRGGFRTSPYSRG